MEIGKVNVTWVGRGLEEGGGFPILYEMIYSTDFQCLVEFAV